MRFVVGTTALLTLTAGGTTIKCEITWDEGVTVAGSNPTISRNC